MKWLLLTFIWLQTARAGLARAQRVVACTTALTNLIFVTNRILPVQYQEKIALVVILRDSKLTCFLSADGWFLGVYLSKKKVLLKKRIIHTWGLKHPRNFLLTCAKYSADWSPADICGWDASHAKVMILWKPQAGLLTGTCSTVVTKWSMYPLSERKLVYEQQSHVKTRLLYQQQCSWSTFWADMEIHHI